MKHLLSYSVFQDMNDLPDGGSRLHEMGCDGLELFTLYDDVPDAYYNNTLSVHLPYAIDWYASWSGNLGRRDGEDLRYITFGHDREEIVKTIRRGISMAKPLKPVYGVMHAGNTDLAHAKRRKRVLDDNKVLEAFAEMMNAVFQGKEPPFTMAFENLWWSGLRLENQKEFRLLERKLEFDDWIFCLDTGHLMNTLPDAFDEKSAIEGVLGIIDKYPEDMKERIRTMHFHHSASAKYRAEFREEDIDLSEPLDKIVESLYPHVGRIDTHTPFSSSECIDIVDAIKPDYLVHEFFGDGMLDAFRMQRSFF